MSRELSRHTSRQERLRELLSGILGESPPTDAVFNLDQARQQFREILHSQTIASVADEASQPREVTPEKLTEFDVEGDVSGEETISKEKQLPAPLPIIEESVVREFEDVPVNELEDAYCELLNRFKAHDREIKHLIAEINLVAGENRGLAALLNEREIEKGLLLREIDTIRNELIRSRENADELAERLHNLDVATGIVSKSGDETFEHLNTSEGSPIHNLEQNTLPTLSGSSETLSQGTIYSENEDSDRDSDKEDMAFKRAIRPQLFHGFDEEDGREFLRNFEDFCSLEEVGPNQDAKKLNLFKLLMKGVASIWVTQLPDDAYQTYDDLKRLFTVRYIDPFISGSRLSEEARLRSRRLKKSETIHALYTDLVLRGSKLGKTDRDLLTYFIDAVPTEYKTMIIAADPDTLEKAVKIAQSAEAIYGSQDEEVKSRKSRPTLSRLQVIDEDENEETSVANEPLLNAIKGLQEQVSKMAVNSSVQKDSQATTPSQKVNRNPDRPLTCYGCGRPGHIRRECRSTRGRGRGRGRGWIGSGQWQMYPAYNNMNPQAPGMQAQSQPAYMNAHQAPQMNAPNQGNPRYMQAPAYSNVAPQSSGQGPAN